MDDLSLVSAAQELDEWLGEHAQAFGLTDDAGAVAAIQKLHTALHAEPLVISFRPPHQQQLINALLIYMDHDECVCDPCIDPGCQGCMYCIAYTALVAIGYIEQEDMQEQQEAGFQQHNEPSGKACP
jgi:hypothetical protein